MPVIQRSKWVKFGCILIVLVDIALQPLIASPGFGPDDIGYYRDLAQKIHVVVKIIGEPDVRSDGQNLVVNAERIFLSQSAGGLSDMQKVVSGKIMIKADRYPEFFYGDELDVWCKLQTPPVFDTFSYAAYLAESDIFVYCTQPRIKKITASGVVANIMSSLWRGFWVNIFTIKAWTILRINGLFAEPQASLVAGILIGQRRSIPQNILDDFNTAGLTHVLAISGYNVSMMIAVFGYLCQGAARRWRYAGMFLGVMALVVFTGFSSSVLRAAWMGCIALVAQAVGRKGSAVHLLLLSAAIMVLFSPRMILVDLSFQLSFLSTLGILLFMPKIEAWEQKVLAGSFTILKLKFPRFTWLNKIPAFMREGFYVTLAAQVFTTPLLFYQFGRFSLIAPIANIFVLPLVPWIMLFSFFALVVSVLFFPLGQLLAFICYALVSLMLFLVSFFAHLPFAAFHV